MLGKHTPILESVIDLINAAITDGQGQLPVKITQVNVDMPDGKPIVLKWDDEAHPENDGTFSGDWVITTS